MHHRNSVPRDEGFSVVMVGVIDPEEGRHPPVIAPRNFCSTFISPLRAISAS